MESIEIRSQPEDLRSNLAVRCAKAALFVSRLKFPSNRAAESTNFSAHEEREMESRREVEDLRRKLVRERLKNRRVKLCSVMELLLQMVLLLSVSMDSLFDARPQIPLIIQTSQLGNNFIYYIRRHLLCIGTPR